jgi:hypothetical protein
MDVGDWLRRLGFEQYEAAFRENNVDDTILPSLTTEDDELAPPQTLLQPACRSGFHSAPGHFGYRSIDTNREGAGA